MRRISTTFLLFLGFLPAFVWGQAPCTTTNASGCQCKDNSQTDCDLLPDITISDYAILNYLGGPTEYSQSGNGANDGRLRVTGSTPNIGVGSFTVGSVSMWTCGVDTFTNYNTALQSCQYPKQLIKQKVYHKNQNTMTYSERWAGSMTYHPTHGHMHVDDWAIFSLRVQDPNEPDPRNWPIVGDGAKVGFCLMDYGECSYYAGHCRDDQNNIMLNGDFVNWGLGGGQYNCSPVEQGISVGHTDIYSENLDGMWIDIPPGTCNGDYYIVIEVDPNDNFLESNENNNWTAVPFTLTQQVPSGQGLATVTTSGPTNLCAGESVTLTANAGTAYTWSDGSTSQSITVSTGGSYYVTVTSPCGTAVSDPVMVSMTNTAQAPAATGDQVCVSGSMTLNVSGQGDFYWYDAPNAGNLVGTGASFTTPTLTASTDYYVERVENVPGMLYNIGPADNSIGTGGNHSVNTRYLEFDAIQPFTLESVWVDADVAGMREIEVTDANGFVYASASVNIPAGQSRVTLNMAIPQMNNLRLGLNANSLADLYRNNGGVNYPYEVQDVASITGSSAGAAYYYFFYDWEVKTPDMECATPRTAVTAAVNPLPTVSISGLAGAYTDADPAVTLVGSPAGGTFSGPGVSGNTFDPAAAGSGGPYTITYTYTDANGCSNTTDQTVTVSPFVSVLDGHLPGALQVYPNPNSGRFTLSFELLSAHEVGLRIRDLAGHTVLDRGLGRVVGEFASELSLENFAKGIYLLEVDVDGKAYHTKIVYQ